MKIDEFQFLLPFQKEGVKQLIEGKPILADDVGLGKSITALSYCEAMNFKKVLIVCPAPLKDNWKNEISKFFEIEGIILEGKIANRNYIYQSFIESSYKYLIVNYEQLDKSNEYLSKYFWDCVIFDEIHRCKNYKNKTYKFANKIKANKLIGLSATILTNTPIEVYAIVNLVRKDFFELKSFLAKYAIWGLKFQGPRKGWVTVPVDWKNLDLLHEEIKDMVIKRNKQEVFTQLPSKYYKNYYVVLSEYEQKLHDHYKEQMKKAYDMETKDTFSYLSLMQQACNGTRMLAGSESLNVGTIEKDCNSKLSVLLEVLSDLNNVNKIIIFSKFKRTIDIIEDELKKNNYMLFKVTGDTKDKQAEVDLFNACKTKSILLATDALNYGFNIPENDVTIHFDLPWTGAKVLQRDGRSERMEKKNQHLVIKLICKNSFEESIVRILDRKQKYIDKTIDGKFTEKDIVKEILKNQ